MAVLVLALVLAAWVSIVVWAKGGPQPVHAIVVALPAPHATPAMGGAA